MHVLIATVGTRGDVQPFVALALGMKRAGFTVTIAAHEEHRAFIEGYGVAFRDDGASMRDLLGTDVGRDWIESSDSMTRYMKTARRMAEEFWPRPLERAEELTEGVDAIVAQAFSLAVIHQAEARRLPLVLAHMCPMVSSRHLAPVFFPKAPQWGWLRQRLGDLGLEKMTEVVAPVHDPYRKTLGLPSTRPHAIRYLLRRGVPILHLYSTELVPRPSDWPDDVDATGFCFLDAPSSWTPPDALVRFLESEREPPIYVGFGSMTGRNPAELTATVLDAVKTAGVRAVVGRGWGGTDHPGEREDVFFVDDAPHDWLFPRVRAVVHHGGAGTLAAGLRAARPTVVAAFFGDQPYWGHAMNQLGAGPPPLLRRRVDPANLAAKIREVLANEGYGAAAKRIGERLTAEDGVGKAVTFIQERLERPRDRFWS